MKLQAFINIKHVAHISFRQGTQQTKQFNNRKQKPDEVANQQQKDKIKGAHCEQFANHLRYENCILSVFNYVSI